jgi:hypothetical protein
VTLGADVELLEAKGGYDVDFGGKIEFKLDPLIGADVQVDILQILIKRAPGISPFLTMVREKAAKGVNTEKVALTAVVELNLIITGQTAISMEWKKQAKDKWLSTAGDKTAKRSVSLTVSLEGKIKVEGRVFFVKVTFGAGFEVKGSRRKTEGVGGVMELFATTAEGKPAVGGEFIFTGATIYYMYYAEVSVKENQNSQDNKASRIAPGRGANAKKSYARREESGKHELLKAKTWPKWNNDQDKDKGVDFGKLDI